MLIEDSHVGFVCVVNTEKMVDTIVKLIYLVFLFSFYFFLQKINRAKCH